MGTTTNNGWPTPVATDLVKDGWEAIKDLGDAIDTTLGVYSPATPMGVHLSTVAFSGVASQSVNDVFSATYDNYRILINITTVTSTAVDLRMRMRVSGSDNSASNYYFAGAVNYASGAAQALLGGNPGDNWDIARLATSGGSCVIDLISPFLTDSTKFNARGTNRKPSPPEAQHTAGEMTVTTSYTGFTIYPSANNLTGTIRVYGFAN
jgi:hypothetical protein